MTSSVNTTLWNSGGDEVLKTGIRLSWILILTTVWHCSLLSGSSVKLNSNVYVTHLEGTY